MVIIILWDILMAYYKTVLSPLLEIPQSWTQPSNDKLLISDVHKIAGLVVNYGIFNTNVLEIPQITTKSEIYLGQSTCTRLWYLQYISNGDTSLTQRQFYKSLLTAFSHKEGNHKHHSNIFRFFFHFLFLSLSLTWKTGTLQALQP